MAAAIRLPTIARWLIGSPTTAFWPAVFAANNTRDKITQKTPSVKLNQQGQVLNLPLHFFRDKAVFVDF